MLLLCGSNERLYSGQGTEMSVSFMNHAFFRKEGIDSGLNLGCSNMLCIGSKGLKSCKNNRQMMFKGSSV